MRRKIEINENWKFIKDSVTLPDYQRIMAEESAETVKLPHTWNAVDGQDGGNDYFRGTCWYIKRLEIPALEDGEEVYVEFAGANSTVDIYDNGIHLAHHEGGYSAFRVKLPLRKDGEHILCAAVDNSANETVYPQKADFTFYGGIYREAHLIIAPKVHFDLEYHGSKGMKVTPVVQGKDAIVHFETWVTNAANGESVFVTIEGQEKAEAKVKNGKAEGEVLIRDVHLWNGLEDPFLYTITATCGEDKITEQLGCRTFTVDPEQGFLLNGRPYPLRGVSKHQDWKGVGNAVSKELIDQDMELIRELGANTIRLAHYQHPQYMYDLCDRMGIIVWAEIPYITCHMESGKDNTMMQMKDLICQNYHHPSIICWGLSNEITAHGGVSEEVLENHRVLNALCHELDSTRLTAMAHVFMLDIEEELVTLPDIFSYNLYYGWYLGELEDNDKWFDKFRTTYPNLPVGLSEYGADAVLAYQTNTPQKGDYTEQYQALYHEHMLKMLESRPYIWASHVWNMFDFGADGRNEGGENGVNHKGLVSFDRKIKKDAFYIYKAYWSKEPFVHICGRRYVDRHEETTTVKIYSNQSQITLYMDGKEIAAGTGNKVWEFPIRITKDHSIKAVSGEYTDEIQIKKVKEPNQSYVLLDNQVINWFEKDGMEFPEGYFSIKDTMGDIKSIPEGLAIMEEFMEVLSATRGEVAVGVKRTPEMEKEMDRSTVERLIQRAGDTVKEEWVLDINRKLNQIKKQGRRSV